MMLDKKIIDRLQLSHSHFYHGILNIEWGFSLRQLVFTMSDSQARQLAMESEYFPQYGIHSYFDAIDILGEHVYFKSKVMENDLMIKEIFPAGYIEKLREEGLLYRCKKMKKEYGYPLINIGRIHFIFQCQKYCNLDEFSLREIIKYQNHILEFYRGKLIASKKNGKLEWLKNTLTNFPTIKEMIKEEIDTILKSDSEEIRKIKEKLLKVRFYINNFNKISNLNNHAARSIYLYTKWLLSFLASHEVFELYLKTFYSYSPQVVFKKESAVLYSGDCAKIDSSIDWTDSKKQADAINLFYTPSFKISNQNKKININITDPQNVTTEIVREVINPIYSKYRQANDPRRISWGEKTGRRQILNERDESIRLMFKELRNSKSLGFYGRLGEIKSKMTEKYGDLGNLEYDTLRKKVYSNPSKKGKK